VKVSETFGNVFHNLILSIRIVIFVGTVSPQQDYTTFPLQNANDTANPYQTTLCEKDHCLRMEQVPETYSYFHYCDDAFSVDLFQLLVGYAMPKSN
jgi:hypothetical protein